MQMKHFIPQITVPNSVINKDERKRTILEIYFNRYRSFMHSPKVHFVYEELFFVFFLALFTWVLLFDFKYYETITTTIETNFTNITENSTSFVTSQLETIEAKQVKAPSVLEWILIFWVLSYVFDEIHQVS